MHFRVLGSTQTMGILAATIVLVSGCARSSHSTDPEENIAPEANPFAQPVSHNPTENNVVVAAPLPKTEPSFGSAPMPIFTDDGTGLQLPTGGVIPVKVISGVAYIPVELTFDNYSFTKLKAEAASQHLRDASANAMLLQELNSTIAAMKQVGHFINVKSYPEVGYASGLLRMSDYDNLVTKPLRISRRVLLNPLVQSPGANDFARVMSSEEGLTIPGPRDTKSGFSGLERIGAVDFVSQVEREIGQKVDGSSVKVGVTDTGITYNHPAFFDAAGKSRIDYLKDFTGEGKVFFNPNATFETSQPSADELIAGVSQDEMVLVTAEYFEPKIGPGASPIADKMSKVEKLPVILPASLKKLITSTPGVRLGAMSEKSFNNVEDKELVDLNQNKKVDDLFWMLMVPDSESKSYTAYIDLTARVGSDGKMIADFRKAMPVGDFNKTHQLQSSYSEKFGFHIQTESIENSKGEDVKVVTAAIVGFDPGNHGSHVSGIIGARKTIANDSDDTLARGVAPAARLMVDRVCANNGGCQASAAIIDLAKAGAQVVNMSLGGLSAYNDGFGVQETIVNRLTEQYNTLFVISAGNSGPGKNTIGSPSVARHSLSVGAAASQALIERQYQWPGTGRRNASANSTEDFMLFFSSRGPTAAGGFKPNIAAPGTELSTVQLNSAPGARSGLDVYWGTSMAAPTATGAVALLMDAVTKFNKVHQEDSLPADALTIRRAVIESARPFDVASFNPKTGEKTKGQYTWIDEGKGMINLPRAWSALKQIRDVNMPSAVNISSGEGKGPVNLDYVVRVLRKNPNGISYDGKEEAPVDSQSKEGRFGSGIWLDTRDTDSFIPVQIVRNLPSQYASREDVGELARQLNTTMDEFELETVYYGAAREWLRVGVRTQLDCLKSPTSNLTVIGQGAVTIPKDASDPESHWDSKPLGASTLNVCVDRKAMNALPAGDHGALINAYRVVGGKKESHPSFTVPVYVAVPHKTLAASAGYEVDSHVNSFEVSRNYVVVPEGTTLVEVSLEIDPAVVKNGVVSKCGSAELMILEGTNTGKPEEIKERAKATASSCDANGRASEEQRIVKYARSNPKAGIWDVHVFGRYNFVNTNYKLKIEFAKVESSVTKLVGAEEILNGEFDVKVVDASRPLSLSADKSVFELSGLKQVSKLSVKNEERIVAPTHDGKEARTYGEDIAFVTLTTGGAPTNDLDLVVLECAAAAMNSDCKQIGQSAGATDEESVTFTPEVGKFYFAVVDGYHVENGKEGFEFGEQLKLAESEKGQIEIAPREGENAFTVTHTFDVAASSILKRPEFESKEYAVTGEILLNSAGGSTIVRIPVEVQ